MNVHALTRRPETTAPAEARPRPGPTPVRLGTRAAHPQLSIPRISIVIPTLNEAENLKLLLPRIPDWVHEIVVVDGCSVDGTAEVAQGSRPDVRVVLERRRGKGVALRAGFEAAEGDVIVMLDADGSTDPTEIPAFVGMLLAGCDFAKGSRFLQGGGDGGHAPLPAG